MSAAQGSKNGRRGRFHARAAARALVVALAFALGLAAAAAKAGDAIPGPVPAEVVKVVDGDTLKVKARIWLGQVVETDVRIARIDAPESLRPRCERERALGEEARARLAQLVAGGDVTLRDVQNDKYGGRVRAEVETVWGENVADLMLTSGLARTYGGEERHGWCGESQAKR